MILTHADSEYCDDRGRALYGICFRKPKPQSLPFESHGRTTASGTTENRYGTAGISDTPEAKAYLEQADAFDVDPGVGRRSDLEEQEVENQYNTAFAQGIPAFIRMRQRDSALRGVRADAASARQQAEYTRQGVRLGARERLLPQVVQTGSSSTGTGTSDTTGFNTAQGQSGGLLNTVIGGGLGVAAAF